MKIGKTIMVMAIMSVFAAAGAGRSARAADRAGAYALNMYHFNIQYVVGSEASMRRIVKQSFEPLVDFYLARPGWGADFEMQGMMIEYMAEKHPEALEKFRRLINSGQCELVTFHYGDQLLLAFPGHDQSWSLKINDQLLTRHGINRSGVIFTQEAQFGEGMAEFGKPRGYDAAVMTTSQYKWFQDDDRFPYFTANGMDVITTKEAVEPATGIKVKWAFCGDGELVATGGLSPYFPGLFRQNPLKLAALEKQFESYEREGYKIATVGEYVGALRAAGVKPAPLGAILDSPWRPEDGSGVLQWMGRYALPWEKDYDMRTRNWQARSVLVEAERAGASEEALSEAWGYLVNAEVSDPSGWFPFPVEVNWDYEMMDKALAALKGDPGLDYAAVEARAAEGPACGPGEVAAPVDLTLAGRAVSGSARWSKLADGPGYCVDVEWDGKGDGSVAFAWAGNTVQYSPAMMEDVVREIPVTELQGKTIHLGLPNGLIGLGSDTWLIRDNQRGCVAGGIDFERKEIRFEVQEGKEERYSFRFYILQNTGAEGALEFANGVNRVGP